MRRAGACAALAVCLGLFGSGLAADGHTSEFVGTKGYVEEMGEKGYVGPVVTHHHVYGRVTIRHRSERRGSGPLYVVPPCPPNFNGMYRGTLYCVDGRPMS